MNHHIVHDLVIPATSSPIAAGNQPGNGRPFNQDWVATSGFMILMMQVGFGLLEVGCVRYKNSSSILIKVILNTTITVLVWWLVHT